MRGVGAVAVPFEHRPRGIEWLCRPTEVARYECDFGLGDNASRAGNRFC
jgi:hypothetical protein